MPSDNTAPTFESEFVKLLRAEYKWEPTQVFYVKASMFDVFDEISMAFINEGYILHDALGSVNGEVLMYSHKQALGIDMPGKHMTRCSTDSVSTPMIKTSDMLRFIAKARVAVKRYWRLRLEEIHKNQGIIIRPKI